MSSKYQREIEEILQRAGDLGSTRGGRRAPRHSLPRLVWLYGKRSLSGKLWSLSGGRVMLFGLVLLLSTLVVRPFVNGVSGYLAWAGLLNCGLRHGAGQAAHTRETVERSATRGPGRVLVGPAPPPAQIEHIQKLRAPQLRSCGALNFCVGAGLSKERARLPCHASA